MWHITRLVITNYLQETYSYTRLQGTSHALSLQASYNESCLLPYGADVGLKSVTDILGWRVYSMAWCRKWTKDPYYSKCGKAHIPFLALQIWPNSIHECSESITAPLRQGFAQKECSGIHKISFRDPQKRRGRTRVEKKSKRKTKKKQEWI